MKLRKQCTAALALAVSAMLAPQASATVTITTSDDASTLIGSVLGGGVTVVGGTENYIGATTQSGTFSGGLSAGLGFDTGIIMTSGNANLAAGPNSADNTGENAGGAGDGDLESLIPGFSTFDAAVLEFEFTTTTGDLFFNFQFASEEYNEFINSSFNDVFGLFVNGTNIALAPDGQAVAIDTVNCGNPFGAVGPNCAFYNNNDLSDGGPFFDIEYDGFTDAFTASITGLGAGTHTMKFAIADAGDSAYDSAVFIEAGSFSGEPPTAVPAPASLALLGLGLMGLGAGRRRRAN